MTQRPYVPKPWHRWVAVGLMVYGLVALTWGIFRFASDPSVELAFLAALFVIMGGLAIAGGAVWLRGLGREVRRYEVHDGDGR